MRYDLGMHGAKSPLRYLLFIPLGVLLWTLTPVERQLGDGVKVVLVHVSLIWVGTAAMILSGACAIAALLGFSKAARWARISGLLGVVIYALGIGMSMIAALVNWGGINWTEPRLRASFRFLAVAAIVYALGGLKEKLRAGLWVLLTIFFVWTLLTPELQMHPGRAIKNAEVLGIQLAFAGWVVLIGSLALSVAYDMSRAFRPTGLS